LDEWLIGNDKAEFRKECNNNRLFASSDAFKSAKLSAGFIEKILYVRFK